MRKFIEFVTDPLVVILLLLVLVLTLASWVAIYAEQHKPPTFVVIVTVTPQDGAK